MSGLRVPISLFRVQVGIAWSHSSLRLYHLRPKSASFNYLLSREQESLLSAQKQLIIAPTSCLGELLGHRRAQPELSVDFGVSSGILYIFKFSLGTAFQFEAGEES